jgi:cytochrome c peroxidase
MPKPLSRPDRRRWRPAAALLLAAAAAIGTLTLLAPAGPVQAQTATVSVPGSLAREPRPEPANLSEFVASKPLAIALGKALFWEMRVGSDGKTACASCHFHAGADTRSKNQLSPGPNGLTRAGSFTFSGPNHTFSEADFPFHQFANPADRNSAVVRSIRMVASSQGAFNERFTSVTAGQATDNRTVVADPVFNIGGTLTRRVEPRNSPTVINAVFNLRNFWDGRAQTIFNGVNPWGKRDASARVYRSTLPWNPLNLPNFAWPTEITLNDSSLASQASGPPLSALEMSADGRRFPELGRKLLSMRPLATQAVAADDSVLGSHRHSSGLGLSQASYAAMIRAAFQPAWWNANQNVTLNGRSYSQMEANFSLFFGLALQLYQATLVSDQAPYDKYAEGQTTALDAQQLHGLGLFLGKGKCIACHSGAAFTNAAIRRELSTQRMSRMLMGDGNRAVYDEGFYNIGVTPTGDDIGLGGTDPWGRPLSFSGLAQRNFGLEFWPIERELPNVAVSAFERIAVAGAFKTPTLRNVELTAPYFHNGGAATLRQVVEFYNRGGNFAAQNRADLDADIEPLGLNAAEIDALVAFMRSLTDPRVRRHAAPFDHPALSVPNGHPGDTRSVTRDSAGRATESLLVLPAVGRNGYSDAQIPTSFLGLAGR